jgi:hypothetical protein
VNQWADATDVLERPALGEHFFAAESGEYPN